MSSKRAPAPPPAIAGYRYVSLLGSGGFADVYLYEQDRPRRRVAVKVLVSDLKTEGARRAFESEANLMAQLSSHPYIVTIYEADVTEDGHSYLAMEYCSRPSLDVRYRSGPLPVAEALAIGIQVSSAVETAHRAGIVHRDIKPANILVTDYNRPALTDFGISGTLESLSTEDDAGMSIPWSPPEAFAGGRIDGVRADVWALGATVYTLLAGRSPFVLPRRDNSQRELMNRIGTMALPEIGRHDVPLSLSLALAAAMSKDPASRYPTAHAFALSLQRVQAELNMSVTPFEVLDDTPVPNAADEDGELTRVRRIVSIDPEAAAGTAPRVGTEPGVGTVPRTPETAEPIESTVLRPQVRQSGTAADDESPLHTTIGRSAADSPAPGHSTADSGQDPARSRPRWVAPAAAGAVLIAAGGLVAAVLSSRPAENPAVSPSVGATAFSQGPADPLAGLEGTVPAPAKGRAITAGSKVTFTWTNPKPRPGDSFRYRVVSLQDTSTAYARTAAARAVVPSAGPGQPTCLDVVLVRATGGASDSTRICTGTRDRG